MIFLCLDASTYTGTVAVISGARVLSRASAAMRGRESERLMPAVEDALGEAGISLQALTGIICGDGPGSFTSLRIAASIAKGIAVGRAIPLFSASSLGLIVGAHAKEDGQYLVAVDALRGESYTGRFQVTDGQVRRLDAPARMANEALDAAAAQFDAQLVGPDHEGAWMPHAAGAIAFLDEVRSAGPVNLASWEPNYGRPAEAQARWEAAHGRPLQG